MFAWWRRITSVIRWSTPGSSRHSTRSPIVSAAMAENDSQNQASAARPVTAAPNGGRWIGGRNHAHDGRDALGFRPHAQHARDRDRDYPGRSPDLARGADVGWASRPRRSGGFFMSARRKVVVYDTTLRDGAQGPDVSFSAADKEKVARLLDGLGFDYVEGGFPGSNPKDEELFARLGEQPLRRSRLAAFGATRRAGGRCEDDANLKALAESGAPVWTLVGKSDTWQVATVLQTTNNENLAMVEESVAYGVARGREVIFDAEHFFDGYARDAEYAIEVCLSAARAGASWVVLCDTNGGSQPDAVRDGVEALRAALANAGSRARLGLHTHNDCELAVANSLAGVMAGADMVQGTINGYGERCGNANLVSVVANL